MVDLDGFKAINDSLGHLVGDAVLKTVAACLKSTFHGRDVIARTGGDEFSILALGKTTRKETTRKGSDAQGSDTQRSDAQGSDARRDRLANLEIPMRIVAVSDTHVPRFVRRMPQFLERIRAERPDIILHCGDFTQLAGVAALEALAPFDGVAGNNDGEEIVERFGRVKVLELGTRRFGLVHGDGSRGTTLERARSAFGAPLDAILFGHSHVPLCERRNGIWLVNPGSPTDKRRQPRYSFAVIEADRTRLEPRLIFFD